MSVGAVPLPPGAMDGLLGTLRELHGDSPLLAELADDVSDPTFGGGFMAWMRRLLGSHGLLFLDPMEPAVRALSAPLMDRVLDDPLAPTRLGEEAGARLQELGYKPPTHRAQDRCGFYLYRDGIRRRLSFADGLFHDDAGERYTIADLRAELARSPQSFSHGLLLRPVVQDFLLPTAMFVVGPGEIAYAAQVGPVFDWLGVARPLLVPRRSATLVPHKVGRVLDTYGLSVCEVLGDVDQLVARVVRGVEGADTEARFAAGREAVETAMAALGEHAASVDGSLRGAADGSLNRMRGELDKLEKQVQRALRQKAETHTRRLSAAHAWLSPEGVPQERRLGLAPLLLRYGRELVDDLIEALDALPREAHGVLRESS
jgi:bacillithiol biosynthesis cysteine-adding enzyme BshC